MHLSNHDDLAIGGAELVGLGGDDTLVQTAGTRRLAGGAGADSLEFDFNFDVIFERLTVPDFAQADGDILDLSKIDARPNAGNQPSFSLARRSSRAPPVRFATTSTATPLSSNHRREETSFRNTPSCCLEFIC